MTLIEAVEALPHEKKRSLIGSLVRTAGSPISRIHLVHLLMRCGTEGSSFWRLARHITSKLLGLTGFEELVAFLAMLKWVSDEFSQGADTKDWPSHLRLAISWTHAHRLFVTFMYLGTPISWLQRVFDQANLRLIPEAFTRDSNSWFDVSHPRRVAPVAFLTSGLSYALGKNGAGLVDEELGARLNSLAFRDLEGKRLPVPSLLRDHSRASNRLLSFLGGDLGEEASSFDVPPV
jgi:hypothetical protein